VYDPDAPRGTWDHWVVWNLPADTRELEPGWGGRPAKTGAVAGSNSWGRVGWRGPCPPFGVHRYVFRLYALDDVRDLPPGAPGDALRAVAGEHALATAELVGRFERAPGSDRRSRVRDV
jgi:Raf kinase inhibitor-like YbhB/YbcL family protein